MSNFFEYDNMKKWWEHFVKLPSRKRVAIIVIILFGFIAVWKIEGKF